MRPSLFATHLVLLVAACGHKGATTSPVAAAPAASAPPAPTTAAPSTSAFLQATGLHVDLQPAWRASSNLDGVAPHDVIADGAATVKVVGAGRGTCAEFFGMQSRPTWAPSDYAPRANITDQLTRLCLERSDFVYWVEVPGTTPTAAAPMLRAVAASTLRNPKGSLTLAANGLEVSKSTWRRAHVQMRHFLAGKGPWDVLTYELPIEIAIRRMTTDCETSLAAVRAAAGTYVRDELKQVPLPGLLEGRFHKTAFQDPRSLLVCRQRPSDVLIMLVTGPKGMESRLLVETTFNLEL